VSYASRRFLTFSPNRTSSGVLAGEPVLIAQAAPRSRMSKLETGRFSAHVSRHEVSGKGGISQKSLSHHQHEERIGRSNGHAIAGLGDRLLRRAFRRETVSEKGLRSVTAWLVTIDRRDFVIFRTRAGKAVSVQLPER